MKNYIKNIVFFCLVITSLKSFAGDLQPVTGILRSVPGTPVVAGDNVEIQALPQSGTQDYNVRDVVSLNFDKSTTAFLASPTVVKVNLTVTRWDASNNLLSPTTTEDLSVTIDNRYNRKTIDKAILKLADGYKVKVLINSIEINGTVATNLPEYVYIESEIYITRFFNFSGIIPPVVNAITPIDTDCDPSGINDEVKINWSTITGAEEYQLEWTYVNDYGVTPGSSLSASTLYADFKNNSTRITTTQTSYNVSLAFERGYIAFRVRAVGRDYLNPDKNIYGYWSSGANDIISMGILGSSNYYYNATAHEKVKNWQYSSTYAEEGKKKEVISYFDGSLHNRQSVTKINSDNNVIVGETIYDFQGRPAINVLPTPVNFPDCESGTVAPSLKYYENFNRNTSGTPYTKLNFDKDYTGNCNTVAEPMDTTLGSSQYYSGNNPYKKDFQAFIPNAERYPFSQVEYTPDNTGRVRAQSGVGKPFQLGSKHETKYIYSWPNQLQLDRLFGSEVGDASHYKKNTVIDANGQVSVSYLNQEGKTIATSLAGDPPIDSLGNRFMSALRSEQDALDTLTVDAFNKDANGKSILNKITPLNDGIEFSSQIGVSYNSAFSFDYSLSIDTLSDPCLNPGFCISCVYDLEIKVTDECGVNLTPSNTPIVKKVGHLTPSGNGYTMVCTSPTGTTEHDVFSVNLTPGVYTVSKTLTINTDARDYYLDQYLDSASQANHCVKTLNDFVQEALAAIDTTACYGSCDECVTALGTKDDFVASGQGTELQYDILLENCLAPCKDMTVCEATYEMLLLDVSPGGQYAKFDANTNTSADPLSVLNTSNVLPANAGGTPNWHNPQLVIGGQIYKQYINDNGERVKVNVYPASTPSGYSPEILSSGSSALFTDLATGQKYVYPENLKFLDDFLAVWNLYFARSLVVYHPEYAYYIACKDQSKKFPGDNITTEQFDSLLLQSTTFDLAVTNGFIKTTYSTIPNPNNRITQWFTNGAGYSYDPFFSNSSAFNSFSGPFPTSYGLTTSYNHSSIILEMQNKMASYLTMPGVGTYSIVEAAAILARCGNNFYATPTAPCMQFGSDFYPNPLNLASLDQLNDSVRNMEWQNLKNFYISEKRKLEFKRMDIFAKHIVGTPVNQPSSEMLGGCNACIGNSSYNPYMLGMFSYPPTPFNPTWDPSQPCSIMWSSLFTSKQKRFVDLNNTGLNTGNIGYQIYQQTGQCPMAFQLQNFVSTIVQSGYLAAGTSIGLTSVGTFNPDLYNAINGGVNPPTFINYNWNVASITPTVLTANIVNPGTGSVACQLTFDISGTPIIDFTKIISVQSLSYDHTSGGQFYFKLGVGYKDAANNLHSALITGSSCIDIINCSFEPNCTPNSFAIDFMNLTNTMSTQGLTGQINYSLNANSLTAPFVTPSIKNTLGASSNNIIWNFVSPNKIELYEAGLPANKLVFTIISYTPGSAASSTVAFANIRSNYNNLFKMDGFNAAGSKIADVDGKAEKIIGGVTYALSMGDCSLPENPDCNLTEHKVRKDLEKLVSEFMVSSPFTGNINLFTKANFSSLLQSYFPTGVSSTSSSYTYSSSYDSLKFNTQNFCNFKIYHNTSHPGAQSVNFSQLVSLHDLTGIAPYDAQQNFHRFYFIGKFNVGGSTFVEDTVFGESCFPLKNCNVCDPIYETPENTELALIQTDSSNLATGKAYYDKNLDVYASYKQSVDSLNAANGWSANNNSLVAAIDYMTFAEKGYKNAQQYFKYVKRYEPMVDSVQYLNMNKFIYAYGNFTNCTKEYKRYVNAVNVYNNHVNAQGGTAITPITDSAFYANNLCDTIFDYIKYLIHFNTASGVAQDVYSYYNISTSTGGGGNNYATPQDSCKILYDSYLSAYKAFESNATVQQACKEAKVLHPLYSLDVIQQNNLCCSYQGVQLFSNYINSLLNATTSCPPVLQSLKDCSNSDSDINPIICQRNYIYFIEKIKEYNLSAFAIANNHTLDVNIYPTYHLFQQAGYCNCVIDYINYLNNYVLLPGNASAQLPQDIDHYGGCTHTVYGPSQADSCKILYAQYLTAVNSYNNYVINHPSLNYPGIKTILTAEQFMSSFCTCAEQYIANLTAIVNGLPATRSEVAAMINVKNACEIPGCVRTAPDSVFTFPPVPYSQNPCVAQMIEAATQNALNAYNQYVDSVTTDFVNRYNSHCLSALENFHYTYLDKEYHFTLYYYDQAGNLVKTIPPEGVQKLDVSSDTSPLEILIKQDRANNHQSVFTSHRMATTYEYNSLNQLVRQDMPDHDKMDICESILPNGLDADLSISSVQMVNSNKGYLTGYLSRTIAGTTVSRGYVYTTNDGGKNWSKVKSIAGANIQKAQFVSATVGYAVADYGMIFKTLDGGYSWDLLTSLYTNQYFGVLNDLYFTSTAGVVAGIVSSAGTGGVYKTTDGGNTFTVGSGFAANDSITALSFDGSYYYASVKNGTLGKIYRSSDGLAWTGFANFASTSLKKVQFILGVALAVGYDGTLLKSSTAYSNFKMLPVNSDYKFSDIYFKNSTEGVALIDSVPNMSKIYKTFDSGKSWQQLSAPGKYYTSIKAYESGKLIAVGQNGLISRVLIQTAPFAVVPIGTLSVSDNFTSVDAQTNTSSVISIAVSNTTNVYLNYNTTSSSWNTYNTSPSVPAAAGGFKKALLSASSSASPSIQALLLGNNGILYGMYKSFSGTPVYATLSTATSNYTDITTRKDNHGLVFYAYDNTAKKVMRVTFASSAATATISNLSGSAPTITLQVNSIQLSSTADTLLIVGDDGLAYKVRFPGGPAAVWDDLKNTVKPVPLNDITSTATGKVMAVGNNGTMWYTLTGNSSSINNSFWYLANTGTGEKLNAVKVDALNTGLIAADNGKLYKGTSLFSANPAMSSISTSLADNLTDVAINTSNNNAHVTTNSGKTLFIGNYNSATSTISTVASNTSGAQNGVTYIQSVPGTFAVSVGNATSVILFGGSSGIKINDVFSKEVLNAHFVDANNGYTVAQGNVIRHTNDGGASWNVVLPATTLPVINKIYSVNSNKALVVGNNKYVAMVNNNAIPVAIAVPGTITASNFKDVNFNATGYGVIVGTGGWAAKISTAGSGTVTTIGQAGGGTFDFNTVHVFNDILLSGNKNFIAAGTNGAIYYYNTSSGFVAQKFNTIGTDVFNDIYFHDDRVGYVVGNSGNAMKCTLTQNIGSFPGADGFVTNGIKWSPLCPLSVYIGHTAANVSFNAIAFATRTQGFLAGSNNVTGSHQHALLMNDESMLYSTRFWYDKLGRMVVSQNTKQYPVRYSYTLYDELGRIVEVGEKYENTTSTKQPSIFGTMINGLFNSKAIDDTKLITWITDGSGARKEVTKTYYDATVIGGLPIVQENLRKRVSSVTFEEIFDGNDQTYQHATHYTYDIHGNVNTLLQDNKKMYDDAVAASSAIVTERFKKIDYSYDLISGKVNMVSYQKNMPDQFYHRYTYDADNRITKVETSNNTIVWDIDAKYFYYAHGPLARVEYGTDKVQGLDYAYTLQGWIKGINSTTLDAQRDMGKDGWDDVNNSNKYVAKDAMSYSLNYFRGDYKAIDHLQWNNVLSRFESVTAGSQLMNARFDLFNGNISSMVTSLAKVDTIVPSGLANAPVVKPIGNAYKYDQLNRLKSSVAFDNIDITNNIWNTSGQSVANMYANSFAYDANGNILSQHRYDAAGIEFDAMTYQYHYLNNDSTKLLRNRLYHVNDNTAYSSLKTDDIDDQAGFNSNPLAININNNYNYDAIGNLIKDSTEQISNIEWTVYGKIKRITRTAGSTKDNLAFDYDASGNRIAKHVYDSSNQWKKTTYYIRDAQGNVMSTYEHTVDNVAQTVSYKLLEQHLYGSSRIGMNLPDYEMVAAVVNADGTPMTHVLGKKQFEMSNHLGNVLTVISDRKIPFDGNSDLIIDHYLADVLSQSDYYPFGSVMSERTYTTTNGYRYGFNGQEKDDEVAGDGNFYSTFERPYDPRLAKWIKLDPVVSPFRSPYVGFDNNPIFYNDPSGATEEDPQGQEESDDATCNSTKPIINIIIVAKQSGNVSTKSGTSQTGRDDKLEASYQNFKNDPNRNKDKFIIIEAENLDDANNQIKLLSENSQVGNLFIDSHGWPGDAWFGVGDEQIDANGINNDKTLGNKLKTLASFLSPSSNVVLLGCGAGAPNTGQFMLKSLAKKLGVPVYGNQSWNPVGKPLYSGSGSTENCELGMFGETAYNVWSEGRYIANPQIVNAGFWSVAKPVIQNGKIGVEVKTINSIYIRGDGTFGVSINVWQDYPANKEKLEILKTKTQGGP